MALIKECRGFKPQIDDSCYLAENATVVGDVKLGKNCSIWFNAVVRGDVNSIECGENVNIQDGAVIHCTYDKETKGGWSKDKRKVRGTIHWVSAKHAIAGKIRLYDKMFLKENPINSMEIL